MKIIINESAIRRLVREEFNEKGELVIPELENEPNPDKIDPRPMPEGIARMIVDMYKGEIEELIQEQAEEKYWDQNGLGGSCSFEGEFELEDEKVTVRGTYVCYADGYYRSADYWHPAEGGIKADVEYYINEVIYSDEQGYCFTCDEVNEGFEFNFES